MARRFSSFQEGRTGIEEKFLGSFFFPCRLGQGGGGDGDGPG